MFPAADVDEPLWQRLARRHRIIAQTLYSETSVRRRQAGCGLGDITYVRTLSGFAYTAFVVDVFSRKIVGVATRSTMRTDALPMEALEHALTTAGRIHGNQLIHHSDRGSQYVSWKYSTALAESGIRPSVGTVGDSYDNALAETVNGLYKAELIHAQGPWTSVGEVELATLRWVHWWNTKRLHEALDYATPTGSRNRVLSHPAHQHRAVKEAELNPGRFKQPHPRS